MKKNVTLFAVMAMGLFMSLFSSKLSAQGTDGQGIVLRVTIDGVSTDYRNGACGYGTAAWGGMVTDEACLDVVWGYDITPDSLGCDSIPAGSLNGKAAMIRRGGCEFGVKALNAEKGGAAFALVANNVSATAGDDCNAIPMGAGAVGDQVTIPALFLCRNIVNLIDDALKANKSVQICPLLPRLSASYAEFHYATPLSQVTALGNLAVNFINRESTPITNMTVSAAITSPTGNVDVLSLTIPEIGVGADTLIGFDPYTPPAEVGEFTVAFYTDKYFEGRDTLRRNFRVTDYTYAVDDLNVYTTGIGLGSSRGDLFIGTLFYQVAGLAIAGPNGGVATYCSFGVDNIDSVYVAGNDAANTLTAYLYKFDSDGNGLTELANDFSDLEIVGLGTYIMQGNEQIGKLIDVELADINSGLPGVTLDPDEAYYVSVAYDGLENGSGRPIGWSYSPEVSYLGYSNEAGAVVSTAPMIIGTSGVSSWSGGTAAIRLQMEGYDPTSSVKPTQVLDASKYVVTPNPANEYMLVNLKLEKQGTVGISIINPQGQNLASQVLKNFQNGQVTLDVSKVPSGTYMMIVRTEEGVGVKKVAICH